MTIDKLREIGKLGRAKYQLSYLLDVTGELTTHLVRTVRLPVRMNLVILRKIFAPYTIEQSVKCVMVMKLKLIEEVLHYATA